MRIFLALLALTLFSGSAAAQLYRWTDDKGRLQVTDTPPPASAKNVQKRAAVAGPTGASQEPFALRKARTEYPVTLYSAPGCERCVDARRLLNARGVPFKEVSITSNEQIEEFRKIGGGTSVPTIMVGSTLQQGFGEVVYQRLLDDAGYPKLGEVPPRNQPEPKFVQPAGQPTDAPEAAPPARKGPYATDQGAP